MGTQKNRLNETVHLSTQNMFKIICRKIFTNIYAESFLSKHVSREHSLTSESMRGSRIFRQGVRGPGPEVIKFFVLLNSTEYESSTSHKKLKC